MISVNDDKGCRPTKNDQNLRFCCDSIHNINIDYESHSKVIKIVLNNEL